MPKGVLTALDFSDWRSWAPNYLTQEEAGMAPDRLPEISVYPL
jgi:hypothetical protein